MATGDQSDMYQRLRALLPVGWFSDSNPILDACLQAGANALAWCYTLYLYAQMQTRIKTASDGWLDMIGLDFFGTGLTRKAGQSDSSYRNQIIINMFRERGTRNAVSQVLYDLTGRWPIIIEAERPADTGGYGVACGYCVAGAYGSLTMPYQAFVTAYRPLGQGFPYLSGYGDPPGAYSTPSRLCYSSHSQGSEVTDEDIRTAVESVKPAGTLVWMRISS